MLVCILQKIRAGNTRGQVYVLLECPHNITTKSCRCNYMPTAFLLCTKKLHRRYSVGAVVVIVLCDSMYCCLSGGTASCG